MLTVRFFAKGPIMKRAIAAVLAGVATSQARIITVDDGAADFNNIQAAIDDATAGDTIIGVDGTYTGAGTLGGRLQKKQNKNEKKTSKLPVGW